VPGQDERNRDRADAVQRRNALRPSAMPARGDKDLAHWRKSRGLATPNPEGALGLMSPADPLRCVYFVNAMYFVSRYSSIPSIPPSRPKPDCLTPPNGAAGSEITPRFTPTIPASRPSATRSARSSEVV
jgi:hypothetical protein